MEGQGQQTTGTDQGTAGTVTPAAPKASKISAITTMKIEYPCTVEEALAHSKSMVEQLRTAGLIVTAEIKETVPSKKAL